MSPAGAQNVGASRRGWSRTTEGGHGSHKREYTGFTFRCCSLQHPQRVGAPVSVIGFPPVRRGGRKLEAPLAPVPPAEQIESRILLVRGQRVLLDAELARLYGVSTGRLNEQVKRNLERFPADFMFQLTKQEVGALRSQFAMSNARPGRGGRRHAPFAFAEHGAIMAATVLNSPRAIEMSLYVVRAFVRLRGMIVANKQLTKKLDELEQRLDTHDHAIGEIMRAIREFTAPPEPARKRRIGFIQSD